MLRWLWYGITITWHDNIVHAITKSLPPVITLVVVMVCVWVLYHCVNITRVSISYGG